MMIQTLLDQNFPFQTYQHMNCSIHVAGTVNNFIDIAECLEKNGSIDDELFSLIRKNKGNFSLVITSESYIFSAVDRIKSYPIYYSDLNNHCIVSNSSYKILSEIKNPKINQDSLLCLSMSGYVFGKETIYENIKQLQAGEVLFCENKKSSPKIYRYYTYIPEGDSLCAPADLEAEFSDILDSIILELIKSANGRPIWVPLSGGLDSRLILAKLVEHDSPNVSAFSYGVSGNHEMKQAKYIAQKLGVPWYKISSNPKRAYRLYHSSLRSKYEKYANGLTHIPSYMEFEAFCQLIDKNIIPRNAIVVNGQTGDFVSGGHVPTFLFEKGGTRDDLVEYIIQKHCSFWSNLKSKKNIDVIKNILYEQLPKAGSLLSAYEYWEWQERQSKLVIRGQRLYDFFGLRWSLPFWHADMMEFWRKIPYEFKINQKLYIRYLKNYNYKGTFHILRRKPQPWVLKYFWIPYLGKIIRLFLGNERKQQFYKRMSYYSTYHDQYALFGLEYYLKHYRESKDPASFMSRRFLKEMNLKLECLQ